MKMHLASDKPILKKMTTALLLAGLVAGSCLLPAGAEEAAAEDAGTNTEEAAAEAGASAEETTADPTDLVDLYCSQTAKDALGYEQLQTLIDLIVTSVEPQAVELLATSFPCFTEGAANGDLGTEIGLYIYYEEGDQDGFKEHADTAPGSFAYVTGTPYYDQDTRELDYRYLICIDAETLTTTDDSGSPVLDLDGDARIQLDTTFCHELFHAFMDDYNRVGMSGYIDYEAYIYSPDEVITEEEGDVLISETEFPEWFVEGLAGCVGNIYPADIDMFHEYHYDFDSEEYLDTCTNDQVLKFYVTQGYWEEYGEDKYDLDSSSEDNSDGHVNGSTYVTGYMACLYLADLAYQQQEGARAVTFDENGEIAEISSEKLREGISIILARLHDGDTLDEVIEDISGGAFADTADFTARFIEGTCDDETQVWSGDPDSLSFCVGYLNYMSSLDAQDPDTHPAGSLLMEDFGSTERTPLVKDQKASSELYRIIEQSTLTDSTVGFEKTKDGGKSYSGRDGFEEAVAQFKENQE